MSRTKSGTLTANGSSSIHVVATNQEVLNGAFLHLDGTFGGGTVQVEFYGADDTWHDLAEGSFTSTASEQLIIANGIKIRLTLSGATSPSLYYQISDMANAGY